MGRLFKPAKSTQAYLKLGGYGTEGSGKTRTAWEFAAGLWEYIKEVTGGKDPKPIGFFDTETGSDFLIPLAQKRKIPVEVIKSRSLKTLSGAIKEAQEFLSILIVDSLTHIYKETCSSYVKQKRGVKFIDIRDWSKIKETWAEHFATPYVNSKLHFIWMARAKNLYEDFVDEELSNDGKARFKSVQVGTGARAETESSYEPNILIEMRRVQIADKATKKSGIYKRVATILKDRFDVIDGRQAENPGFDFILPHVRMLNIGGEHLGFTTNDTSEELFRSDIGQARDARRVKRALEEIVNELLIMFPSQSANAKAGKAVVLKSLAGTSAWENDWKLMHPDQLELYLEVIQNVNAEIAAGKKPSGATADEQLSTLSKQVEEMKSFVLEQREAQKRASNAESSEKPVAEKPVADDTKLPERPTPDFPFQDDPVFEDVKSSEKDVDDLFA